MPDIKKVINELKWFRDRDSWREGIMIQDDHAEIRKRICDNALALLKEQQEEIENLKQTAQSMMEGVCLLKEQETMKECLKKKCVICPHCDNCDVDENGLLKEQEAVRWISVTEKLPKSMANKVIVYLQHDELVPEIGYGHYEKYKGVEMWYNLETNEQFSIRGYTVTHWMPMPKSPEGEKLVLY